MPGQQPTAEQIASRHTLGRWLFILGGILLFVGLYISVFMIPDAIQAASGPQSMTLAEAAQVATDSQTYARIEDGSWDCDTLTHVRGLAPAYRRYGTMREETKYTEIFFTDNLREVAVFITLSGEVGCSDLEGEDPSGYLYAMNNSTRQELTNDARLARYFTADTFLEFCGYCGRENSLIGAVFGVVFTLSGIALLIVARKLKNTSNDPAPV